MPGYIPKEQLDAYQRWQVESFDPPGSRPVAEPPAQASPAAEPEPEVVHDFGLPTAEDIERIHNEAQQAGYQAGFEEGRLAGLDEGRQAASTEAERLARLADNFSAALSHLDQTVADHLLELGTEIARQMVMGALSIKPDALLPVIREALAALPIHHGHVLLHVNPDDAEFVRNHLAPFQAQQGMQVVEDASIATGGCLVRAGNSEVDATLESRWKRVIETIGAQPTEWLEQK